MENAVLTSSHRWQHSIRSHRTTITGVSSKLFQCVNVSHIRVGKEGPEVREVKLVKDEEKNEVIQFQNSTGIFR